MIKGLLLRQVHNWVSKPSIFHAAGTLNIGYTYPNTYMREDYNPLKSPYWCLKSLLITALPPYHPPTYSSWASPELPPPSYLIPTSEEQIVTKALGGPPPHQSPTRISPLPPPVRTTLQVSHESHGSEIRGIRPLLLIRFLSPD